MKWIRIDRGRESETNVQLIKVFLCSIIFYLKLFITLWNKVSFYVYRQRFIMITILISSVNVSADLILKFRFSLNSFYLLSLHCISTPKKGKGETRWWIWLVNENLFIIPSWWPFFVDDGTTRKADGVKHSKVCQQNVRKYCAICRLRIQSECNVSRGETSILSKKNYWNFHHFRHQSTPSTPLELI